MRKRILSSASVLVLAGGILLPRPLGSAFTPIQVVTLSASASVTGTNLSLQAIPFEPGQAVFLAHLVIPVELTSGAPLDPQNLRVDIVYQLFNAGSAIAPPTLAPIRFDPHPSKPNTLAGSAFVSRTDLAAIRRGGRLDYIFQAQQSGQSIAFTSKGPGSFAPGSAVLPDPFQVSIVDELCSPVHPGGAHVSVPDLFTNDGQTSVSFDPGALASPGTLCIKQEDERGWPPGPGGAAPAAVYSIQLQNAQLLRSVKLVLTYPADLSGKVGGLGANPTDLAIYWLDPHQWRPLSRSVVDSTMHTVTGATSHFSTFALFASGPVSAASLRPPERIITPNGDGMNDTVTFSGLVVGEEARIFDVRGRRVRTLPGPDPVWDGRDDQGDVVESGVYIYQFTSQGDRVSGVIAVAKGGLLVCALTRGGAPLALPSPAGRRERVEPTRQRRRG